MVSFDDIKNMGNPRKNTNTNLEYKPTNSLLMIWILTICYTLSLKSEVVFPSVGSLLGIYYVLCDLGIYYCRLLNDGEDTTEATSNEEADETEKVDETEQLDETEQVDEADYETSSQDDRDLKSLMQLKDFAKKINEMNLVKQSGSILNEDDEYADLPPLIPINSVFSTSSNPIIYTNSNLRQRGHYAASINETDM